MRCGFACADVLPLIRVDAPAAAIPDKNVRREMPHRQPASCATRDVAFTASAMNRLPFCTFVSSHHFRQC
jgi:hypothetical protein